MNTKATDDVIDARIAFPNVEIGRAHATRTPVMAPMKLVLMNCHGGLESAREEAAR